MNVEREYVRSTGHLNLIADIWYTDMQRTACVLCYVRPVFIPPSLLSLVSGGSIVLSLRPEVFDSSAALLGGAAAGVGVYLLISELLFACFGRWWSREARSIKWSSRSKFNKEVRSCPLIRNLVYNYCRPKTAETAESFVPDFGRSVVFCWWWWGFSTQPFYSFMKTSFTYIHVLK